MSILKLLPRYLPVIRPVANRRLSSASHLADENLHKFPKRIFSGIQPTGVVHIGNYLGALQKWVTLQNSGQDVTYCIVDLHSITLPQDPLSLRQSILQLTATLLSIGIDPAKSTLFAQSSVKQHAELNWIFSCLSTMARLSHLPQYKEKTHKLKDIPLGLFVYPVLQAADILVHKATHVPVGEDQVQHIQLAQHLARIFNFKYGTTFPTCHAIIDSDLGGRIKSLRDPTKKMSKSDPDPKSCIYVLDEPDVILGKVKKSITDFTSEVTFEPETRPGVGNLLQIHSLMSGKTIEQCVEDAKSIDTGKYKFQVAEAVIEHLNPIRKGAVEYMKNKEYLISVLKSGGDKASERAEKTIVEVKEKVGLGVDSGLMPVKLVNEL